MSETAEGILVDSPIDVILCHQHGFCNAFTTFGTLLTNKQAILIRNSLPFHGEVSIVSISKNADRIIARAAELLLNKNISVLYINELEAGGIAEYLHKNGAAGFEQVLNNTHRHYSVDRGEHG